MAEKEKDVGGKKVDILAGRLAFEVAIHNDVDVTRVLSALPDLDEYYFLCQSVIVEQSIGTRLPFEKVKFRIASDFLLALLDSKSNEVRSITNSDKNNPINPKQLDSNSISPEQPKDRRSA